jgi:O-antigen/teichoic acid export membrane protein
MTSVPSFVSASFIGILIARMLGDEGKGALGLISFNIEMFVLILGLSIGTAITYFLSNQKISSGKVYSMSLSILAFGSAVVVASYFIANLLDLNIIIYSKKYFSNSVIIYFFTLYFITVLKQMLIAFLQGFQKIDWINRSSLITAVLAPLFIFPYYLYVAYEFSIVNFEIIVLTLTLISFLTALPLLYFCLKVISQENIKLEKFGWKDSLLPFVKFSFIGHLSNLVNFLNYRIDIWFITFFFHDRFDLLGHYLVAVNLSQMVWMIPLAINLVYFPILCAEPSVSITIKITRFNNLLVLAISLIGLIVAPFIIPFLYTDEFQASVLIYQILLGGMFFSSLTKTLSSYIFAVGKVKINLLATIVGVIITLILDLILIPAYGIIGAAWATNITYFGIFTVCFIFLWIKGKKDGIGNKVWSIFVPYATTTRIENGR